MTSFGGQTLALKFTLRKASYRQFNFLPVTPAQPHPLYLMGDVRYRTLTLENGDRLEKSTYVNVRELYEMDWRDAQLYWGANPKLRKGWKLDGLSMQAVLSLATSNLRINVGRQYSATPAASPATNPPYLRDANLRSQLLYPLNRRLSNHASTFNCARTTLSIQTPVYRPATPPHPSVPRSPTTPTPYRVRNTYAPAIRPPLQAEFSPPQTSKYRRTGKLSEALRAQEEQQPLLPSYGPQNPHESEQTADDNVSMTDGTCEFWRLLLCRCM